MKVEVTCECGCGRKKVVRQADINRGWGRFYDKSCKARAQARRIGRPSTRVLDQEQLGYQPGDEFEDPSGQDVGQF